MGTDSLPRGSRIDETLEAPLPRCCPDPDCPGAVVEVEVQDQFQTELPEPKPITRRIRVHIGECQACGRRVQGRHPQQTSDALGAAASQLGPNAIAVAVHMNKQLGLSYEKVQAFYNDVLGVPVTRGGLVQAVLRTATRAEHTYQELHDDLRANPVIHGDETGARLNGKRNWLWGFRGEDTTVYRQVPSRGFDVIEEVLGADWNGFIVHDGWGPYDKLTEAIHQQCLGHFVTRSTRLLEVAEGIDRVFPEALKQLLKKAMALGRRYRDGLVSAHGLTVATGRIEKELDRLLDQPATCDENRKLAAHARKHRDELFTFLHWPDYRIEPVNWEGEQTIRFAVIFRKCSGGHRSERGARAQDILKSVIETARQRGLDIIGALTKILCSRRSPERVLDPP